MQLAGETLLPSPVGNAGSSSEGNDEDLAVQEFLKSYREQKDRESKALKRKKKAEENKVSRKEQKSAVRNEVAAARAYPSQKLVTPSSGNSESLKRTAGSDVDDNEIKKRSKGPQVGGLKRGWKTTAVFSSQAAASSKTSLASSNDNAEPVKGEFDAEESPEALKKARDGGSSDKKVFPLIELRLIVLVPANVKEIDAKERKASKTTNATKTKRRQTSRDDLPFPVVAQKTLWLKTVWPAILKWAGSYENQFGLNSGPEVKEILATLWTKYYPPSTELPATYKDPKTNTDKPRVDHPALIGYADYSFKIQAGIRSYRSDIGKRALMIVGREVVNLGDSVSERAEWAQQQLLLDRWMYEEPGLTRKESKGALRGPLLLEVFALFLSRISTSSGNDEYQYPAGALALSAAAVFRALDAWKTGTNSIQEAINKAKEEATAANKKPRKVTVASFGEDLWKAKVDEYYKLTKKLQPKKWQQLLEAADMHMKSSDRVADDAGTTLSATEGQTGDDVIVLSD
ncbi:hypothetical protein D9758_013465 [Tetrapyrgos nigripes]|uniref:DUF6532 domain-containing protein n=1 Tax=Tetrapyrgos nigripes TaxID=182062 RepID=A0A8H5CSI4_9AGAR|nr:hypothetical protein D9758_013465 [Tetrapyrgos nigripes]